MAIFKVPKGVIKDMDKIRRRFLWGGAQERNVWAKVSWSEVCRSKKDGGLGIANLEYRNKAMLYKWWWRYGRESDSLWRKVIVALYGNDIQSWRPIQNRRSVASKIRGPILKLNNNLDTNQIIASEEFRWLIGNGKSTLFWWDKWADSKPLKEVFPRLFSIANKKLIMVNEMLEVYRSRGCSREELFRRRLWVWEQEELRLLEEVMDKTILRREKEDVLAWCGSADGVFSTRKATQLLIEQEQHVQRFQFDFIWKVAVPATMMESM